MKEALDLLEPMTMDGKNFVRQGALIAQAMICIQQSEARNPLVWNMSMDESGGNVSEKLGRLRLWEVGR